MQVSFAKEENKFLLLPIAPFTVYLEERDGEKRALQSFEDRFLKWVI